MSKKTTIRTLTGRVVSDSSKRLKTITVKVERKVKHPLYNKYIRRSTKLHAHDEDHVAKEGDMVRIKESKPISKTKTWVLDKVVEQNQ